jgi:hypothetical protein
MDKQMWYLHAMEYYLTIKKNGVLINATMWMNFENTLNEKGKYKVTYCMINFYETLRTGSP